MMNKTRGKRRSKEETKERRKEGRLGMGAGALTSMEQVQVFVDLALCREMTTIIEVLQQFASF